MDKEVGKAGNRVQEGSGYDRESPLGDKLALINSNQIKLKFIPDYQKYIGMGNVGKNTNSLLSKGFLCGSRVL